MTCALAFTVASFAKLEPEIYRLNLLIASVIILVGALLLSGLIRRGFDLLAARAELEPTLLAPIRRLMKLGVLAVAVLVIVGLFGFNLGGLWTALSAVAALIAVGFVAVWSLLSNITATFLLLITRPFALGDDIEFVGEQTKGKVADLSFLYTTLETEDGATLKVPNNLFFQRVIKRRRTAAAPVPLAVKPAETPPAA